MGMQVVPRFFARLWRVLCVTAWCLLGAWTALALFFTIPTSVWLAAVLALGIAALYLSALRERCFVRGRSGMPWRHLPRTVAALAVTAAVAVWYFGYVKPDPNEDWISKHSRMPHVEIVGDKVHVNNVRNFTWRTPTDYTPGYYDRVYDLTALNSMYFILSPILQLNEVAHVWVSFGFSDGQTVSVSVEARGVKGRPYRLLGSMFRQHQLIYVIGDERDVVGLRGAIWRNEVRVYPVRTTNERKRAMFVDMMQRACSLEEHPEFYNLFTNNCMNNVTAHVRRLGDRSLPSEWRLLLTGLSDRFAFRYGFIDTELTFEQAHQAYRIDEWMLDTPLDDSFAQRMRTQIAKQVADMLATRSPAE